MGKPIVTSASIKGAPGFYVRRDGTVWRVNTQLPVSECGERLYVSLRITGGAVLRRAVDRLVGEAFCDDYRDQGSLVKFKDGNWRNCRADNLQWFSRGEKLMLEKGLPIEAEQRTPPKPIPGSMGYLVHAEGYISRNGFKVFTRLNASGVVTALIRMKGGYSDSVSVGRVVGTAFDPKFDKGLILDYKDGNKQNCALENLVWKRRLGANPGNKRNTRLTDQDIADIVASNEPRAELAARYGISKPYVTQIRWCKGRPQRDRTKGSLTQTNN